MPTAFSGVQVRPVVLGGDQPVPRIERRRDRRSQIHVAEAQDEIVGPEHGVEHGFTESSRFMRRMNSMFHGHHGASARTPCT